MDMQDHGFSRVVDSGNAIDICVMAVDAIFRFTMK